MTENLPAVPGPADVAEVLDGTVVEAEPEPPVRPAYTLHVVRVVHTVSVVIKHEHTRAVARHAAYVPAGAVVLARRRSRGRTLALDFAHQAKASGDHANGLLWAAQHEAMLKARHDRRRERRQMAVDLLRVSHWIGLVVLVLMLLTGAALAYSNRDLADVALPFTAAANAVADLWALVQVLWVASWFAVPLAGVAALYRAGRRGGDLAPGWSTAAKAGGEGRGLVVTSDGIAVALKNLPVPELKKAFKEGWTPAFHTLPIKDGEGYFSVFSLPMGVTATMVADKNEIFARNLYRAKTESWPTDAERQKIAPAGNVALWVANPGVLDKPAPDYPLLHDGTADVFQGVPGGVTARGDQVLLPVVANNLVLGGQMGNGKSNGCRVFMLGCALDPLCELNVFVFAGNGDFDSFAPRLAVYVKGARDETVVAAVARLQELLVEVGHREDRLSELGAKKVTRNIAERHRDMRPIVALFSECHELFGHKEHGELAAELAVAIIKRARKTGVVLAFDTQSSRAGAIPSELVELVSVNGCFYVKTWRSNDGFLGDGSFQAGIRATELRPTRDIGRSLITGVSEAQFELLKWHYIFSDDDTGEDDAAPVIARAMANLAPGTRVSGGDGAVLPVVEVRDLLDDLAEVLDGSGRVKVNDLPQRLRRLAPAYGEYRALNGVQLRDRLIGEGVRTVRAGNVPWLDPADLDRERRTREAEGR